MSSHLCGDHEAAQHHGYQTHERETCECVGSQIETGCVLNFGSAHRGALSRIGNELTNRARMTDGLPMALPCPWLRRDYGDQQNAPMRFIARSLLTCSHPHIDTENATMKGDKPSTVLHHCATSRSVSQFPRWAGQDCELRGYEHLEQPHVRANSEGFFFLEQ